MLASLAASTDPDSTSWTATVDYGDGSGVQPLPLSGKTFMFDHVYELSSFLRAPAP